MGDGNGTTQMGNITSSIKLGNDSTSLGNNSTSLGNNSNIYSSQTESRTYVFSNLSILSKETNFTLIGTNIVNLILLFGNSIQESEFTPLLQKIHQVVTTTAASDTKQGNL